MSSNQNFDFISSEEEIGNYSVKKKDLNKIPMGSQIRDNISKESSKVFTKEALNEIDEENIPRNRINHEDIATRDPPKSPRPFRKKSSNMSNK